MEPTKTTPAQRRQARVQARRRRKQHQATGCVTVLALLFLSVIAMSVFFVLDDSPNWSGKYESNPYGPGDFVQVGGYMTCTAGATRQGIDVSEYQEDIDWAQVRSAGFDFAFIRIGYRGYTTGEIKADDYAANNLENARAVGMDIGVYFYAQAVSEEEAREEARWCLDFLNGTPLDLPVVYDWEYVSRDARTGSVDRETLTACVRAFCEAVEAEGYQSMVYFNPSVGRDLLDLEALAQYPWWLAMYTTEMDYPHKVDIWQYTETGSVPGIKGNVDIDLMFLYK